LLNTLLVAAFGLHSPRLSPSPLKSASVLRLGSSDMSLTTLLSLAETAVVQLLARSASYPCLFAGLRQCPLAATYPAPGSYIFSGQSRRFPRFRIPVPLSTCTSPRRPICDVSLRSTRAFSGLYATPESFALQSVRVDFFQNSDPNFPASSGGHLRFRFALVCSARLRLPPSICSHEHLFQVGPFSVR